MSDLVSSEGYDLDQLCGRGAFGIKQCTMPQYLAWRRVALGLRKTLLEAKWEGHPELYKRFVAWMRDWVDPAEIDSPTELARAQGLSMQEADPSVEGVRFPPDPSIFDGGFGPLETEWNYTDLTERLGSYIRGGEVIYREAKSKFIVKRIDADLAQAEARGKQRSIVPWWLFPAALLTGVTVLGTWAYTQIVRAKGPQR